MKKFRNFEETIDNYSGMELFNGEVFDVDIEPFGADRNMPVFVDGCFGF